MWNPNLKEVEKPIPQQVKKYFGLLENTFVYIMRLWFFSIFFF